MSDLYVDASLTLPEAELQLSFARSGGPGGQNVNKVETKVVLRFSVRESPSLDEDQRERLLRRLQSRLTSRGELVIHASRHRARAKNIEDARERLAVILAEGLRRRRPRKPTRPTRGSIRRRLEEKRRRSETKQRRSKRNEP